MATPISVFGSNLIPRAHARLTGDTIVEGSSPAIAAALQDDDEIDGELDASATGGAEYPDDGDADEEESFDEGE